MKPKTIKTLYWVITIIFCVAMLLDGIAGLNLAEEGKKALHQLGYPEYIMTITGIAKILGAIAILQTKYSTVKEWAYAGFAIDFIGAAASWAFVGGGMIGVIPPLVALAFMFVSYFLWKKYEQNGSLTQSSSLFQRSRGEASNF